ncbi:MAG: biotin--[acetyl-CoA-carboxylase] ligase, partial [Thermocrispum sp.]
LAEAQTAGVGRLGRTWASPVGAGLYLSVLLRPSGVPAQHLGSLAVVAGLALADVAGAAGVDVRLKWPNDVLAPGGKIAGVLSELVPGDGANAVVLGMGLNVHPLGDVPAGPGDVPATSLEESGARDSDRSALAVALLRALADRERAWRSAAGDLGAAGLLDAYRAACVTLGSRVRVSLPDGQSVDGDGADIDAAGQLVVATGDGGRTTVFAGDVVHVR